MPVISNSMIKKGVTLLEICITLVVLTMLFGSGYMIMSYAREQSAKGFWIQQTTGDLRNALKRISKEISNASYPSATYKGKSYNFYDYKEYKGAILSRHEINKSNDKAFSMHTITKDTSVVVPVKGKDQIIFYLPKCKPAINGKNGKITWCKVFLRQSIKYNKLGNLYIAEYKTPVDYGMSKEDFNELFKLGSSSSNGKYTDSMFDSPKLLISDVVSVKVSDEKIEEGKNIEVATKYGSDGKPEITATRHKTEKHMVMVTVNCQNPRDAMLTLSNRCCIIVNVNSYDDQPVDSTDYVYKSFSNNIATLCSPDGKREFKLSINNNPQLLRYH